MCSETEGVRFPEKEVLLGLGSNETETSLRFL